MDDTKSLIFPPLKLDDFRPEIPPKKFPVGHTAEVTSLLDHLRGNCAAHGALMRALERPMKREDLKTPDACADFIIESLWLEGFIIVPATVSEDAG